MVRLGAGELTGQGLLALEVKHARRLFLNAVAAHVPCVLTDLRDDVLPIFRANADAIDEAVAVFEASLRDQLLYDRHFEEGPLLEKLCRLTTTEHVFSRLLARPDRYFGSAVERFAPVRTQLFTWGKKYHLEASWVYLAALETVGFWYWGHVPDHLFWYYVYFNKAQVLTPEEQHFEYLHPTWSTPLTHPGWNPFFERWFTFKRSVLKLFLVHREHRREMQEPSRGARRAIDVKLSEYRAHILCEALERGLNQPKSKYTANLDDDTATRHFRWLALCQCASWSPQQVAEHDGVGAWADRRTRTGELRRVHTGRSTVQVAIDDLARLIRLPRRPAKRGRPAKRK